MTFKDKTTKLATDIAVNVSDAEKLAFALSAKADSDSAVAHDIIDVASAVKAARGGFVVDATVTPPLLYQSADGLTFTATPIGSATDEIADPPTS